MNTCTCVFRAPFACRSSEHAYRTHTLGHALSCLQTRSAATLPCTFMGCLRCVADACCWAWTSASPSAVARTYAATRPRSRPWQPSRTTTADKRCAEQRRRIRCSITPAPRILVHMYRLESQPRAAAMGKDRKKVGNAYVHTYRCTCMHVCTYVPIFVSESVRVRE